MLVALESPVSWGKCVYLIAASGFDEGNHLALCIFREDPEAEPVPEMLVEVVQPAASRYIVHPWFFLLDGENGERRHTVCMCHAKS
jgi:hypothetical protein